MPSNSLRTIGYFSLGGLLLGSIVFFSLWGPESGLLQDAYRAESERLFESFEAPLAKAAAQSDDLAQIDELRRLQKLPGIVSAEVNKEGNGAARARSLVWDGKTVGHLEIRLHKTRWQLWRYRWLERILTLCIFLLLGATGSGYFWTRAQDKHKRRVMDMLHSQRWRLEKKRQADCLRAEEAHTRWVQQSLEWTTKGLLALDGSQRIVAMNDAAMRQLKVKRQDAGLHWLDHTRSPAWAAALRHSVENPGVRAPAPEISDSVHAFLITVPMPDSSRPESTWIVVDSTSE